MVPEDNTQSESQTENSYTPDKVQAIITKVETLVDQSNQETLKEKALKYLVKSKEELGKDLKRSLLLALKAKQILQEGKPTEEESTSWPLTHKSRHNDACHSPRSSFSSLPRW